MKNIMWRLLRKHVSAGQLIGFSIANLIGLTIVILAVQFYNDVSPIFNDEESFIKRDYLVVTKRVTGLGSILGSSSAFTATNLQEIESQTWVRKVGKFTTSDYAIYASVGLGDGGRQLRSHFFFESIPTEFIDIKTNEWHFDPSNPLVPVIVSKDYLALYNFGFASAQGMPQISEGVIGMIPLSFTFSGNGREEVIKGKIVGFSNRLNTILVPDDFIQWSNERYSSNSTPEDPSRIIVEVNNPGDIKIKEFMESRGYEIAGDKMESGKANYFLTIIISIIIAVGVLISALSFFVLMLSIYLILQKNSKKLQDMLMLGYSPAEVSKPYIIMVSVINLSVCVGAIIGMLVLRAQYMPMIKTFDIAGASLIPSLTAAVVIMALITIGNIIAISRKIATLWRQKD